MLILEHGHISDRLVTFSCDVCGCRWVAGPTEYRTSDWLADGVAVCECPDCGHMAAKIRGEEHDV